MIRILILLLLFTTNAWGAAPSRPNNYVSGNTINPTENNENENTIYNYLQAGVDSFADGSIVNADINASANIQSDKLNLTSIAQDAVITSGGSLTNNGSTTLAGTNTLSGANTLSGTNTISGATTFSNNVTFASQTIADLGTVTTADINGGTIDGTNIGASSQGTAHVSTLKVGTTNQGDVLYDNGTSFVRLTPGTNGQYLQTQGAGANPQWATITGSGWSFIKSNTFSSSSSVSITETISAGDLYMIIYEGTATAGNTLTMRFNSASTSSYGWSSYGHYSNFSTNTAINANPSGLDTSIGISGGIGVEAQFTLVTYIQARTSDSQVNASLYSVDSTGSLHTNTLGNYNAGTPTSIQLLGTGLTGRNYVYKANQS